MLNAAALNTYPLNSIIADSDTEEPIIIPVGDSFRWSAIVMMGGVDVTHLLTGTSRTDREKGGAGIAEFQLLYMPGTPVDTDLANRSVTIDYITDNGFGAVQERLFTGVVAEPRWDAVSRVMSITATDNLQNKVEALPIVEIDSLTPSSWSEDVFSPVDGRSRWDYAQERMSTRTASLNCDVTGALVVTDWHAKAVPDYVFGSGTTIYESLSIDLAQIRNVTNRVEIEVSYRYQRLNEARKRYVWDIPPAGAPGFCTWRMDSTELPDKTMVYSAISGAAAVPVSAAWGDLPATHPDPCGNGQPWINRQIGLLLSFDVTAARRWTQSVTETYKFNLTTAAGAVDGQQVISRQSSSISIDNDDYKGWESSLVSIDPDAPPPLNPTTESPGDKSDEARRSAALRCMLDIGRVTIIESHSKTQVSWSTPTSMALGVNLGHTVELDDQYAKAKAVCSHRVDELDFESGSAITSITLSVMRGGGVSDAIVIPPRLGAGDPLGAGAEWSIAASLPTQLGGKWTSPAYDDALDGFSGNYSSRQDFTLEVFPRRLAVTAPIINEQYIDEKLHESSITYAVGIPNDLLEL